MPYMSMGQSIRNNGDRHFANAVRHAANGNKEYAFGSYLKAKRNWKRADRIDEGVFPRGSGFPLLDRRVNAAYDKMKCTIEDFLYG